MSLTREAIKLIALSKTKNEALSQLRKIIIANYKIRSDLWRHEIFLSLIYDLSNNCLKKGFTLEQCLACSEFFENLLNIIRKPSTKLPTLVDHTMDSMKKLSTILSNKSLQDFIDYINMTILTHFNLYKYVFCFDKDDKSLIVKNSYHCPSNVTLETDSKNVKLYEIWSYEQKIKSFEEKENEIKNDFEKKRNILREEEENAKKLINFIINDAYEPIDEEIIKKFISNSSILVLNATKNLLKCEMDEVKEKVSNTKQKQQFVNSEIEAKKSYQSTSITPKNKKK